MTLQKAREVEALVERARAVIRYGAGPSQVDEMYELIRDLCAALEAAQADAERLREACATFVEWLDREEAGGKDQPWREQRGTPEGEAAWRTWYNENLRLCDLAQTRARAALPTGREGE